jgi:hypothetical protein
VLHQVKEISRLKPIHHLWDGGLADDFRARTALDASHGVEKAADFPRVLMSVSELLLTIISCRC